jgi:D-sedoheptulose 7-phosphate isomerase
MQNWEQVAESHLRESIRVKEATLETCLPSLLQACDALTEAFGQGKKLLICGNGGSAADAQHLAAEFISTLSQAFPRRALPAIALTTDSSTLTSRANDYGFDEVFSRQVEAFGQSGDVLLSISTSGGSKNCVAAMKVASELGVKNIALVGGSGGQMGELADIAIVVPSHQTMHIQESHLALYHILCHIVERKLNPEMAAQESARLG